MQIRQAKSQRKSGGDQFHCCAEIGGRCVGGWTCMWLFSQGWQRGTEGVWDSLLLPPGAPVLLAEAVTVTMRIKASGLNSSLHPILSSSERGEGGSIQMHHEEEEGKTEGVEQQ